ncbi:MAG: (Na+)-NQR maturation NqrM [Gammaproteobacteria bacterium]|tara:strand:+ start:424 stop:603 length:180 start_codon:yes stop_codon:yes gene_type:complete
MSELFLGFVVISISFIGLSLGVILRSQPIKGSCGGMANLEEGAECQFCGRTDPESCSNN